MIIMIIADDLVGVGGTCDELSQGCRFFGFSPYQLELTALMKETIFREGFARAVVSNFDSNDGINR